jgi:hypothetical protein
MSLRNAWNRIRKIPIRTLLLFAVLGTIAVILVSPREEKEKDFTPQFKLNAIKGSNTPAVLFLSGKFTETWQPRPGAPTERNGEFEMYIRGTNSYFLKCWHGDPTNRPGPIAGTLSQFLPIVARRYSGWSQAEIIVDGFDWRIEKRWGRFGSQGGSGSGNGFAPGRRLWNSSGFIGAIEEGQINKECEAPPNSDYYAREIFKDLQIVSGFHIPRVIQFNRYGYSQTYRVKKCEFRDGPGQDWFLAREQEYAGSYTKVATPSATNTATTN